jgi:hypothetical protein
VQKRGEAEAAARDLFIKRERGQLLGLSDRKAGRELGNLGNIGGGDGYYIGRESGSVVGDHFGHGQVDWRARRLPEMRLG